MNKNLIIAILAVVIIAIVAFVMFSQPATEGKINTQINMLSQNTLQNGDQIQFELKDGEGNLIADQDVNIGFADESGNLESFKINTDSNGKGYLVLEDEDSGSHELTVTYDGNDKYNGCSFKQTITIEEGTSDADNADTDDDATANSSDSSDSNSDDNNNNSDNNNSDDTLHYDEEYGLYYDDYGTVHGGQADGMSIYDIRERGGVYNGID